ncbi:MAG: CZB domain-containing protein [Magnetococcales bacterium]|nr:CZB domain-containing protein [Magnetococcales bacterium]
MKSSRSGSAFGNGLLVPSVLRWIKPAQGSVGRTVLLLGGAVGALTLLIMGGIQVGHLERSLVNQNEEMVSKLVEVASQGLQTIMIAGSAPIAKDYLQNLRKVEGFDVFRIFRVDGSEAFLPPEKGQRVGSDLEKRFRQVVQERQSSFFIRTARSGGRELAFFVPLLNQDRCHVCHGSDHAVRGIFHLTLSLNTIDEKVRNAYLIYAALLLVSVPLFAFLLLRVLKYSFSAPMARLQASLTRISQGDLTSRIPLIGPHQDEIGVVAREVNILADHFSKTIREVFLQSHSMAACVKDLGGVKVGLEEDSLRTLRLAETTAQDHEAVERQVTTIQGAVNDITEQVGTMSAASEQLSANIAAIATAAEEVSSNITTVASAAEEITANIAGVNTNLEQVDHSVTQVAKAVQEVTTSLEGVRKRCQLASEESRQANQQAQGTREVTKKLADSAREIGNMVEMIDSIADQTNMLALNASIEAAGAGEAGKGFAVVANEVKDLARQTSDATKMISEKIREIQDNTREVSEANDEITTSIGRIDQTTADITLSVDEQADSVNGIARSMSHVAEAAGEVTRNAKELNMAAQDVARSALEAAAGTGDVARSAAEASQAAGLLAHHNSDIHATAQRVAQSASETATSTINANQKVNEILRNTILVNGAIHHTALLIDSIAIPGHKLKDSVKDITIGDEPFDVQKIKWAHLQWLGKLENVIRGRAQLRPEQVASGHECDFGKWYDHDGTQRWSHLPIFGKVGTVHLRVHEVARETVRLVSEGHAAKAEENMNQFNGIKDELFDLLDQLYREAAEQNETPV